MTNYTAWFWSLGIGIPLFAIGMALLWRGAHTSIFWRLIFCFCLAIVITPVGFNNGDSQGWVFPFIFLLADSLVSRQHNEIFFSLKIFGKMILPMAIGLFVIWSIILIGKNKSARHEKPDCDSTK